MKDEALSPVAFLVENLPVAQPSDELRGEIAAAGRRIIEIAAARQRTRREVLEWLAIEHDVHEPNTRLQSPLELHVDALVTEVRKVRGKKKPLSLAGLRSLREEHAHTISPAQVSAGEASGLELRAAKLVMAAYGLTPDEIRLIWNTAPPRMPLVQTR